MTIYETTTDLPLSADREKIMIEKIREIAWPRLRVVIEATDRRELARKIADLNMELESWQLPTLDIERVERGRPGTLNDAFQEEGF